MKRPYNAKRLLCLILLLPLLIAAPARAENTQGIIHNPNGGNYVNLRAEPSYDGGIMARLPLGSTVEITMTVGVWYAVWTQGLVGYVHSSFVTTSGGLPPSPAQNATVRSGPLNVREAPSMRARAITQLPTGMRVSVVDEDGTWSRIQAAQVTGYVVSSYLTRDGGSTGGTNPPVITPNANATIRTINGGNLNLRSWASSSAPVIGSYANSSRVRVIARGDSWCQVQAGSQTGYMSAQFLSLDGGSTGGGYSGVVSSSQRLNLRAEPSTNSRSLGQYYNGTYVEVLGVGSEWHRVRVDGTVGYMMADYVRLTSSGATPHKTIVGGANGYVNLRSGPGYDYSVIRRISNGQPASVVIPYPAFSQVLVRSGTGYERGYIDNSFLK